jgi:hypothetical protein
LNSEPIFEPFKNNSGIPMSPPRKFIPM